MQHDKANRRGDGLVYYVDVAILQLWKKQAVLLMLDSARSIPTTLEHISVAYIRTVCGGTKFADYAVTEVTVDCSACDQD